MPEPEGITDRKEIDAIHARAKAAPDPCETCEHGKQFHTYPPRKGCTVLLCKCVAFVATRRASKRSTKAKPRGTHR